jgi:rSAM/selenodomain-associated transferase 1
MNGAVVVFARQPVAGRVKTRLSPPLSPAQAADLYRAMLADVLDATADFAARRGLAAVLAVTPPEACAELAQHAPAVYQVVAQRGPDLSARMAYAVAEQAAAGRDRILLRGSDSPALDAAAVEEALAALEDHDLSVCPDQGGGYALIGLREPAPGLFDHPMGTARALDDTLERARGLGLRIHFQPLRFDLDHFEDLRRLAAARSRGCGPLCPRTLAWLDAHSLWPGASA